MEQYKNEGNADNPASPIKVSDEFKQIKSVESTVKQLLDTVTMQQQEITKLHREISRLKNDIGDIVSIIRNRG